MEIDDITAAEPPRRRWLLKTIAVVLPSPCASAARRSSFAIMCCRQPWRSAIASRWLRIRQRMSPQPKRRGGMCRRPLSPHRPNRKPPAAPRPQTLRARRMRRRGSLRSGTRCRCRCRRRPRRSRTSQPPPRLPIRVRRSPHRLRPTLRSPNRCRCRERGRRSIPRASAASSRCRPSGRSVRAVSSKALSPRSRPARRAAVRSRPQPAPLRFVRHAPHRASPR